MTCTREKKKKKKKRKSIRINAMKKLSFLIAAMALMLMAACNEKAAKSDDAKSPATEQADQQDNTAASGPKVSVEKAAPTDDGKDHAVAEFSTKDYQVKLENLADGTYRLSLSKGGKAEQVVETKQCVMQKDNYLMKDESGKAYIIKTTAGSEELTIMDKKQIIYHGGNSK